MPRAGALVLMAALALPVQADETALRAIYAGSSARLENSPFDRPLFLESLESPGSLRGDIYARIEQPFAVVSAALTEPQQWCEALLLPFNIKFCGVLESPQGRRLGINLGRKFDQPLPETYRLDFAYTAGRPQPGYFEVRLTAAEGPVGTHDYLIRLEAIPVDERRTFLHLGYSYGAGWSGRLASRAYFATTARDKVGFSRIHQPPAKEPQLVGGLRGAVERNAMRYYLAIEAHVAAHTQPPEARFERSLQHWFDATEQYPRQLHEMDRGEYLAMKRKEHARQLTAG